jgi:hypothetical protein
MTSARRPRIFVTQPVAKSAVARLRQVATVTINQRVNPYGAHFPRAREAGADPPSSVSRPTRAQRPAGAAWPALRLLTDVDGDNGCHP